MKNDIIKVISYLNLLELSTENSINKEMVIDAYRKLSKIYHPDLANSRYKDGQKFIALQEAKEYLINNILYVNALISSKFCMDSTKSYSNYNTYDYQTGQKAERERKEREQREKAEREKAEREKAELQKRIKEEKTKIRDELNAYLLSKNATDYSSKNWKKLNELINDFLSTLSSNCNYKSEYDNLVYLLEKIKTLKQDRFRKKIIIITIMVATFIVFAFIIIQHQFIIPNSKYFSAIEYIKEEEYTKAEIILNDLGDYKDSTRYLKLIDAYKKCETENYEFAIDIIEGLDGAVSFDFDYDEGNITDNFTFFIGENVPICEKKGYLFSGYVVNDYELDMYNISLKFDIKAVFSPVDYNIVYDLDGGQNSFSNPSVYNIEYSDIILNEPVKKGYTFLGWVYDGVENPTKGVVIKKGTTGNLHYSAVWQKNIYKIKLHENGGDELTTDVYNVFYNELYELPIPQKEGYIFVGWYNEEELIENAGYYDYDENIHCTAKWVPKTYTITFNSNGGECDMTCQIVEYDSYYELPVASLDGYCFVGWYIENELINDGVWKTDNDILLVAKYKTNEECFIYTEDFRTGIEIKGIKEKGMKNVVIPTTINGLIVKKITYFSGGEDVKTIIIKNNIISIARGAFRNCQNLESITLPFVGISAAETEYNRLGDIFHTWDDMHVNQFLPESLKEVIITDCHIIYDYAFFDCKFLEKIESNSVTGVDMCSFQDCESLTIVSLSSLSSIGSYAFRGCTNLESIELPATLKRIDDGAFDQCHGLKKVYYKGTIEEWCKISLGSYYVDWQNRYHYVNGNPMEFAEDFYILDSKNGDIEYNDNRYKYLTTLIIPNTISEIHPFQFYGFKQIKEVFFPEEVVIIKNFAFGGCGKMSVYCEALEQPQGWEKYWFNAWIGQPYVDEPTIHWGHIQ